jgi:hypothetical protein
MPPKSSWHTAAWSHHQPVSPLPLPQQQQQTQNPQPAARGRGNALRTTDAT